MTTSNGVVDGGADAPLSSEQAAEMMRLAESGDTSVLGLDFGAGPTGTPAKIDGDKSAATGEDAKNANGADGAKAGGEGEKVAGIPDDQQNADNTVILAKDGKHTIPFDTLAKTRQQRDEAIATAATATAQLQKLLDEAAQREAAGKAPTKMDNLTAQATQAIEDGADAELFGDFSEEALKQGIVKLVEQQVSALVGKELAPIRQREEVQATNAHEAAIYEKHPNAVSIVESTEFAAWVWTQPKVTQAAIWATFDPKTGGTAEEIVEVLDAYTKTAEPKAAPTPAAAAIAAAAKTAEDARKAPPMSITSIPGARVEGTSLNDSLANMTGEEMHLAMENMTPAAIESFLNKQL